MSWGMFWILYGQAWIVALFGFFWYTIFAESHHKRKFHNHYDGRDVK